MSNLSGYLERKGKRYGCYHSEKEDARRGRYYGMSKAQTEKLNAELAEEETGNSGNPFVVKVAGVTFGTRQKALERLTYFAPEEILTVLVSEPLNPYDENAIAVKVLVNGTSNTYCIGYIPREYTSKVKSLINKLPELKIGFDGGIYNAELKIAA